MDKNRTLSVTAIEHGTVIDHITPGQALRIVRLLTTMPHNDQMMIGLNLPSRTHGHKDLVKVTNRELTAEEVNRITLYSPHATVNIIRNYRVYKKFHPTVPPVIKELMRCLNQTCITNHEPVTTIFYSHTSAKKILLTCHYCEKVFPLSDMQDKP